MVANGGCECGALRYKVEGNPKTIVVCHCTHCQRQSGSAFGMSMIFEGTQFKLIQGKLHTYNRQADSGNIMVAHFCPQCGTRIYNQKQDGERMVILKPGTLDDPKAIMPVRQLWANEKQRWININLPSFAEQSG